MNSNIPDKLGLTLFCMLLALWNIDFAQAQNLEPRRWSHLPVGLNVVGAGYGYTDADIFVDPVLRLEDFEADLHILGLSYVHTFDWYGKSARVDVVIPYAMGRWEGILDGEFATTRRHGFADPRVRFSVNLYGAPALKGKEYLQFQKNNPINTTIGAALSVITPLGEYSSEKLINLGGNRWILRPQLGVLHQRNKWQFEVTGSVFLYQENREFWQGTVLEQKPLWFLQAHVIYSIKQGMWASLSAGYAYDGHAEINGDRKFDHRRQPYTALSFGMAITPRQSVKIAWLHSETNREIGKDFDTFALGWSYFWAK